MERNLMEFGSSVREQLTSACNWLRENPGSVLFIPAGDYILEDKRAKEVMEDVMCGRYGECPEPIMFNPKFVFSRGLDLNGCRDVTINAYGARLMVNGFMEPVSIRNAENVSVNGLIIDHLRKPFSRATVHEVNDDGTAVIDFDANTPPREMMASPRNYMYDIQKRCLSMHFVSWFSEQNKKKITDLRYILPGNFRKSEEGNEIYFIHTYHSRPAVLISHSVNTTLRDVTIHSQPGMGIVGFKSRDVLMDRIHIVSAEGYHVSVNTDATHFSCCSGTVTLINSTFSGHGDDAINIQNYYYDILNYSGSTCTVKVTAPTGTHAQEPDFPLKGFRLQLVDRKTLKPLDTYTVVQSSETEECRLTLDHALPENCVGECLLANLTELPALRFENNLVQTHLSRGVLCKTHNAIIRNNYFERGTGTAVHIAAEAGWREGIASENVLVSGNTFHHTGYGGYGVANDACAVSVNIDSELPTFTANHKNITIENNTVYCPETIKYAFFIRNAAHVTLRGNKCFDCKQIVGIDHCEDVTADFKL